MNKLILLFIGLYQTYISPYKGYRCAHGVYYQGDSCSGAIKKIIQRRGVVKGYKDIRSQFQRCHIAYEMIQDEKDKKRRKKDNACCDVIEIPFEVVRCIPKKWCKGPDLGDCDLPCDCS